MLDAGCWILDAEVSSPVTSRQWEGNVAMVEKLAIDGGKPVRAEPLTGRYPGAMMIGEEEKRAVLEILESGL